MGASRQTVIIADTSGLISLCLPGDHNHAVAVNAAEQLKSDHKDILIPAAVFVEFLNILGRKVSHSAALAAAAELTSSFRKFQTVPQSVSFTDCLVTALADEYATHEIFGFDK